MKNIFIITNEAQAAEVRKQLPKLPKENVVAEPIGRDTCAAVTLGAALVGARSTTGVMAVLPADHVIPEAKKFQQVLTDAFDLAGRGQAIVTIGIKPTEPNTGYGYIRVGRAVAATHRRQSLQDRFPSRRAVCREAELRHRARLPAKRPVSLERGHVRLVVRDRHRRACSIISRKCTKPASAGSKWRATPTKLAKVLAKEYPAIKKVSIDYALMEKAHNVVCADGAFEWDDLGSWTALARHIKADAEGNCAVADFIHVDARAQHHLRRAQQRPPHAHRRRGFARFDSRANGRCRVARPQEPGAEGEGVGQETRGGRAVEEVGLTLRLRSGE